ncbi:Nramp family divalent metal transporter [Streptomyces sp. Tu 3180]|uniref:Nramp family divalent metal transporter n=1 Tax=Streptomyces sp. Tu 3180 TaxID=2682611 RepID=UPI00135BEB04|nr:Nramp family divalent metal transporter [Streptomyces sp. Tu 3180]KAF3469065.1 Nramp family divalent metal transporter [Streptomyces sp. Tu 3180]
MLDPASTRRVPDTPLAPPTRTPSAAAGSPAEPVGRGRSAAGTAAGSRPRMILAMLGPAFVVSVAYVDPGNFATNMTAGTRYGPMLLWVIAAANVMAVFVQYLACKAGVATGRDLPQLCRAHTPRSLNRTLWLQAELVAMATDLAEFVGGAVALHILFGIPLLPAAFIVAATSLLLLTLAPEGRRRFEIVTAALLLVILAGFVYQAAAAGAWSGALSGMRPRFADTQSILLTTGMIGATVMPHVIYLHSSLARSPARSSREHKRRRLRAHRSALFIALGIAGLVNASMLTIAAAALHGTDTQETLEGFHAGLGAVLGSGAAFAFALALLASGLASSGVGTFAGQVILRGFLGRRIPLTVRRLVTMAPPLVVLSLGVEPTQALVLSQVVLSFGVPFALVPLLVFTARRRIMGDLVNRRVTTVAAVVVSTVISVLNVLLLVRTFAG